MTTKNRIDTDTIEKYILGGKWENQYPQVIEELLAEVKRLREGIQQAHDAMASKGIAGAASAWNTLKEMI
jgi:hypothetical protein